jgi:hypothetical protein
MTWREGELKWVSAESRHTYDLVACVIDFDGNL